MPRDAEFAATRLRSELGKRLVPTPFRLIAATPQTLGPNCTAIIHYKNKAFPLPKYLYTTPLMPKVNLPKRPQIVIQ